MATIRDASIDKESRESREECCAEDRSENQMIWETIQSLLSNERERRAAFLLYCCGLKPREILTRCPGEFSDAGEIYRLNVIIVERMQNNKERLRWLLSS